MKQFFSLCTVFLLLAIVANADIARPRPVPSPQEPKFVMHSRLTIVPDNKAYEARLQISQSSLNELRAALGNTPASASISPGITQSSTRTMLAGLFMFLSLSFAGVWLARPVKTRGQKVMAALLVGTAVVGAAAIIVQANAGPPGSYYWRKLPQNFSKGTATTGDIAIEIVADTTDGSGIKLIVPTRPL